MGLLARLFGKKNSSVKPLDFTKIDTSPDEPCPFGYKTAWYAIKDETPESVIEKLKLEVVYQANWKSGLEQTRFLDYAFVSPSINGFVLVINLFSLSRNADHSMAMEHARPFGEFYYFGSHRIADYYGWAKFINGKLIRAYANIAEGGDLCWNEGNITAEELNLGFDKIPVDDNWEDAAAMPDEDSVIDIAKAWSICPLFNGLKIEKSTGYICALNCAE